MWNFLRVPSFIIAVSWKRNWLNGIEMDMEMEMQMETKEFFGFSNQMIKSRICFVHVLDKILH